VIICEIIVHLLVIVPGCW